MKYSKGRVYEEVLDFVYQYIDHLKGCEMRSEEGVNAQIVGEARRVKDLIEERMNKVVKKSKEVEV